MDLDKKAEVIFHFSSYGPILDLFVGTTNFPEWLRNIKKKKNKKKVFGDKLLRAIPKTLDL